MPTTLPFSTNRESRYPVLLREREKLAHRDVRRHRHRIAKHARFEALDLGDFHGLLLAVRFLWTIPMPPSCAMAIAGATR